MPASYSLPVKTRPATIEELPLLLSSFTGCMKNMRLAESAERRMLTEGARQYMAALFVSPHVQVLVAEHAEAEGVIAGWLAGTRFDGKSAMLWVYTKSAYRKTGVARQLMGAAFDGIPQAFGLYHGAFAGYLRRKGSSYAPFAAMLIGRPDQASQNLLEM